MVNVDKAIIASYDVKGKHFEILVDADIALEVREGKPIEQVIGSLLASEDVYKDSNKGERASPKDVFDAFGTEEILPIAKEIVLEGRVELTTEQKRKKMEMLRKEIILYISKNAINPMTKTPHPPQRIELALDQVRVSLDPTKPLKKQIDAVIEKIKPILPLSFDQEVMGISVPISYANKALGYLSKFELVEKKWNGNGLQVKIKLSSGMKQEVVSHIYSITSGQAVFE
jgi:ribosome maturation protein SDO1